jgi:Zn-dependent protease
VFFAILAVAAGFGWLCWTAQDSELSLFWKTGNSKYYVFGFVFTGWIASLCIHEWSHARVALWGGDQSVVGRGYLTLNPIRYTHPALSLMVPLVLLAISGVGLPGETVWVNPAAIRDKRRRSLMSLAGPFSNFALGAALAAAVKLGGDTLLTDHVVFTSALSFLALSQFVTAILNMLPVPGFDGFGAIEPFLNQQTLTKFAPVRRYGMFVLFILVLAFRTNAFSFVVSGAQRFAHFFGVPDTGVLIYGDVAQLGRALFRAAVPFDR